MSKTHVIDGVTYVEVNRKAKVGDKLWLVNAKWGSKAGGDYPVEEVNRDIKEGYVKVVEPFEEVTVDQSQASPAVIEMFTALSRKIVSLERQLADTQRNVERQAEELENAKHVASLTSKAVNEQGDYILRHATRLGKMEDSIEMLTDDIITLDDRSQVLNAINKYYAEGSR